jgi:DNA-binding transcriptional ArsR family regulator
MNKKMNSHELKSILLRSPDEVSDLIKTAAHTHRLQVLALLVDGPKEFSFLLDIIKLSKTALANHLTQLMNKGFAERYERGTYQITKDGQSFLEAVATFYMGSKARELSHIKKIKTQYSKGYEAIENLIDEKTVTNPPQIEDAWLTYVGAVAGVLKSLGTDCDVVDVGGYSGYTFLVNVAKGMTCPSGPTAHQAWEEIHRGTESLGWKLKFFSDERPFPLLEEVTPEDRKRARKLFELVKKEIDENDRSVVVWGLPVPEYGIVIGYKGDSYLASTVRRFIGKPETPVRYDALQSPGCLEAIFFVKKIPIPEEKDKNAIKRALEMAEGRFVRKGYVTGPSAYEEWASILEKGESDKVDYLGNSYVGACIHDARRIAKHFLERLAKKYANTPKAAFLLKAAEEYGKAEKLLNQFVNIFPFAHTGEMSLEKRKKGAEILRAVKKYEVEAIAYMREAYFKWQ